MSCKKYLDVWMITVSVPDSAYAQSQILNGEDGWRLFREYRAANPTHKIASLKRQFVEKDGADLEIQIWSGFDVAADFSLIGYPKE